MELIPIIALRFFLVFTMLPSGVQSFTMTSDDLGYQEWHRSGDAWLVEDKAGKEIFRVIQNGNEVRVTTSQKFGSDYCKDCTAYITATPKPKDVGIFTFDVRTGLGSSVVALKNQSGLAFYQETNRFLFRHPVIVTYR